MYLIGFRKGTSIITMTRILKGNLKRGVGEKIYLLPAILTIESNPGASHTFSCQKDTVVKSKKVRLINSVLYRRQTKYCWKPLFQLRLGVVNEQRFYRGFGFIGKNFNFFSVLNFSSSFLFILSTYRFYALHHFQDYTRWKVRNIMLLWSINYDSVFLIWSASSIRIRLNKNTIHWLWVLIYSRSYFNSG